MFTLLAAALSGAAHADDAAIKQSLAKLGVQSTDIQPAPVAGMKTVLTDSGVLYVTDDGKHIIQGPMYDVERRAAGERHQPAADGQAERAGKRDDRL
jgi:thiol:disulfide interchange protein DsbC